MESHRGNATGVPTDKLDSRTNGLKGSTRRPIRYGAAGTFGNLGGNAQRGFGINDWDSGLNPVAVRLYFRPGVSNSAGE